jgi:hypothetical protein
MSLVEALAMSLVESLVMSLVIYHLTFLICHFEIASVSVNREPQRSGNDKCQMSNDI